MTNRDPKMAKPKDRLADVRDEVRDILREINHHTVPIDLNFENGVNFSRAVAEHERSLIAAALRISAGKQKEAARLLQLRTSTLCTKIKALGIDPSDFIRHREAK